MATQRSEFKMNYYSTFFPLPPLMNTEIEISEKVNCCFFLEIAVWTASQISLLHAFMCYTYIKLGEESIYVFVENLKGKVKFSILFSLIWCRLKSSGLLKSCNFNQFDLFWIWVMRVKNEQFWNLNHFWNWVISKQVRWANVGESVQNISSFF